MSTLHLPWLEFSVLIPLLGGIWVGRLRDQDRAHWHALWISGLTLAATAAAWQDFFLVGGIEARDPWDILLRFGRDKHFFTVDTFSAPLLPLTALLFCLTTLATLRTKVRRFSFAWTLIDEAILLAMLSCKDPWGVVAFLSAGTVHPFLEMRARDKPTRVYVIHMALFVGFMVVGRLVVEAEGDTLHSLAAVIPLLGAIFIRSGIAPFHTWLTDLFEHATFGTALLFVTPIPGAYATVRLVLPIAPDWVLYCIGLVSLITAVYAAGMALVQKEARRFFVYIFLSHSALVLVGLETVTAIGLTGALCMWLSVGIALGGFGLTLRALEARHGRLSLTRFHGLYDNTPALAVCFLLTGMASVGFPGTFGFLGAELLVDGAVEAYPFVGVAVVVAAALNGIAVVMVYFTLFTGTRHSAMVPLEVGMRERFAVLLLAGLILCGGLFPQPGVDSRYRAAEQILRDREFVDLASARNHEDQARPAVLE